MSGLKSAWELSLEKADQMNPDAKPRQKLTAAQKERIAEIRREYTAKIADKQLAMEHKLKKLPERVPPANLAREAEALKAAFAEEKKFLEVEMDKKIGEVYG